MFNRVLLLETPDYDYFMNVLDVLKAHGIPCRTRTKTPQTSLRQKMWNVGYDSSDNSYEIFVKKEDQDHARYLIESEYRKQR